jgi:hypothetical protein
VLEHRTTKAGKKSPTRRYVSSMRSSISMSGRRAYDSVSISMRRSGLGGGRAAIGDVELLDGGKRPGRKERSHPAKAKGASAGGKKSAAWRTERAARKTPKDPNALADGWVEELDDAGDTYYYNARLRTASWTRPVLAQGDELPEGWQAYEEEGRTYYYHARDRATTWTHPSKHVVGQGQVTDRTSAVAGGGAAYAMSSAYTSAVSTASMDGGDGAWHPQYTSAESTVSLGSSYSAAI